MKVVRLNADFTAEYLGAGLSHRAKKGTGCTVVSLHYLIRFPLAKGGSLYV